MKLVFQDGPSLDLRELCLVRSMAGPLEWNYTAKVTRDSISGEEPAAIAKALSGSAASVYAQDAGLNESGRPAVLVGAAWQKDSQFLDLRALGTSVDVSDNPDPFSPKRRVHSVSTMGALLEKFVDVCASSPGVLTAASNIKFSDEENTSIVQDGISDWQFVRHVLTQCEILAPGASWPPLTVMGSVANDTAGRWLITPGRRNAYEEWNDVTRRTLTFEEGAGKDGFERIEFSSLSFERPSNIFPCGVAPSVVYWRRGRAFISDQWKEWTSRDLPLFDEKGAMIWKVEDRLFHQGTETVHWTSRLWTVPEGVCIPAPFRPALHRPWTGIGKVTKRSKKSCWLEVELDGFKAGEQIAHVRLTTPYSGRGGKKGQHMTPEAESFVKIHWSGRFGDSLLFGGNVRDSDTIFDAPSLFLEDRYTGQYADVLVQKVGQVSVQSDFNFAVNQSTSVSSSRKMQVNADGADLNLSGGVVYTGRGV